MTKISSYLQGFDDKSLLERQVDATNQRNSWLRQMELAQWSEMNQSNETHESGGALDDTRQGKFQARTRHESDHASSTLATTRKDADAATHVQAQSTGANESDSRQGTGAPAHGVPSSTGGWTARDLSILLSAGKCPETRAPAGTTTGLVEISAWREDGAQLLVRPPTLDAPVVQGALPRPLPLPSRHENTKGGNPREARSSQDESMQRESSPTETQLAEMPTWQKRLMHVTSDGRDVAVWIRDSELGSAQSSTLVCRLAGEFADSGLRLKSATVNGKLEYRADNADLPDGDSFVESADRDTDSMNSTITTTREDHAA